MIKILSPVQPITVDYSCDIKKQYIKPAFLVSFDGANNCASRITKVLLDDVIGIVLGIDLVNSRVNIFCGDGIIETNHYGGGYQYHIGEELGASIVGTWVPKNVSGGNKVYGKCLGVDTKTGILQIETYFSSVQGKVTVGNPSAIGSRKVKWAPIENSLIIGSSGGNCSRCGIFNEYQSGEYICWSCKSTI